MSQAKDQPQKSGKDSDNDLEQVKEIKLKLNEVQSLLELWDEIRTNPDGSLNEKIDAQVKIITFGEELINQLSPDLPLPQRKQIIEKLEQTIKDRYMQTHSEFSEHGYYQFVLELPDNTAFKEEFHKQLQQWLNAHKGTES